METRTPTYHLVERDRRCVWHPFTQAKTSSPPIPAAKGEGSYLIAGDGTRYFDAISSWWVTTHGHCHPHIVQAIARQAASLDQAVFADFTHENGVLLAERLLKAMCLSKGKVFFTDNGSTAVEAALKMAVQYWNNKAMTDSRHAARRKIISFENGYHGDTFGAMSAAGKNGYNRPFWPYLFQVEQIAAPTKGREEQAIEQFRSFVAKRDVAAFIFEPIVQGAGGMVMHSPTALDEMLALCQKAGVVTIADEVMTGFGRTGPLFACDGLTHRPMITCLSKGLTGGFLPLGATVCADEIYETFFDDSLEKAFLHGHSYCANPIACAAALASLDLYDDPACLHRRRAIEGQHQRFKNHWGEHPALQRCEVAGTILAAEFKVDENMGYFSSLKKEIAALFLSNQIYVRPMGNLFYLIPPYCSTSEDLEHTYQCLISTLENSQ